MSLCVHLSALLGLLALLPGPLAAQAPTDLSRVLHASPSVVQRRARLVEVNERIRVARLQPVRMRGVNFAKLVALGPQVAVDLRPTIEGYRLSVRDQGNRGTCSVHALAFCQEYMTCAKQGAKGLNYSVEYLNWAGNVVLGKPYHDGGFYADLDLGYRMNGSAPEALAPYQAAFNANWSPGQAAVTTGRQAPRHTARFIKAWDNTKGASQAQLDEVVAHIKAKRPVALGAFWPNHSEIQEVDGVDLLQVPSRSAAFDGHSVVLVGYHRNAKFPGGGYFIFRNSWGKGWGNEGYGYMPFKYVLDLANDLLVYL